PAFQLPHRDGAFVRAALDVDLRLPVAASRCDPGCERGHWSSLRRYRMSDFDIVIRDGIVVDGTGAQRYRADVGIRDGRIARIGRIGSSNGARVIDASGAIVAPGFIDLHTHYDAQLFWDPYLTL